MSLGAGLEVSRVSPFLVCSLPPACSLRCELSAVPATMLLLSIMDSNPLELEA